MASSSKISNTNVYVNIPADIDLTNGGAVTVAAIRGISTDAGLFEGGTLLQVENVNVYSTNTDIGFAGGMENAVQEWDGYVDIQTEADLDKYANSGLNFRLLNDLTIEFSGTPYTASVIETLNTTFDGNGHTITITANHTDAAQSSMKNLIGTIGENGVLTNATINYNLVMTNNNVWSASLLTSTNNGTMSNLTVNFNIGDHWIEGLAGYLSYSGTGSFEDIDVTLSGVHHGFLRGSDAEDRSTYSRAGIVNADGSAATVNNLTIHYGSYLANITEENVLGLLAAGKGGQVNNIIATNVTAVA